MQNSGKLLAVASLVPLLLSISSEAAVAKWSGNVRKTESKRLTRPLQDFANVGTSQSLTPTMDKPDGKLRALVNDNQFGVGINSGPTGQGAAAAIEWPERLATKATSLALPASTEQAAAQIDYAAIEQAYADAVPRHPMLSPVQQTGANVTPNLVATAANNRARLQELQNGQPGSGSGGVDLDNCACDAVIPTTGCMQSRTIGLYAPNNGTVRTPTMHSMNASHAPALTAVQSMPAVQTPGSATAAIAPGAMQLGVRFGR